MTTDPRRGEVWRVKLDPAEGAEMQKTRPVVVMSIDGIRALPLRLVVPLTEMQPHFANQNWKVRIKPEPANGLTKESAADVLQTRGVDVLRFSTRLGHLAGDDLDEIAAAIALVVDFRP